MNSRHQKLVTRFLRFPRDFEWREQVRMLDGFGFWQAKSGKTAGSAVRFEHATVRAIHCHRPHPGNIVKRYALKKLLADLQERELL